MMADVGRPGMAARWPAVAVLVAALAAGAAACGSDGGGPVDPGDDVVEIHMTADFKFDPPQVTVAPGTKVRWINDSNLYHTVTPQNPDQPGVFGRVTSSAVGPVFEFTFTVPGQTYVFRCESHSTDFANGMVGRVVVQSQ